MIRLLQFLYLRRVLILFIFLEVISIFLIKNSSPYYSAYFFSSSNYVSGEILNLKSNTVEYFNLVDENKNLREKNAELMASKYNSLSSFKYPKRSFKNNYLIKECMVISNTIHFSQNYITLDIGEKDGVKPGMGVIADDGIVGIVKSTSNNFSTVTSLLHNKFMGSVKVGKTRDLARLLWNGDDYKYCNIASLPRHVKVSKGDTIYTSGYGGVFPEEIVVGLVEEVETENDKSFHKIKVKLSNDFNKLNNSYVVIDRAKEEKDIIKESNTNE